MFIESLIIVVIIILVVICTFTILLYTKSSKVAITAESKCEQSDQIDETQQDRDYLLLFLACSFYNADKLTVEKKTPHSEHVILVFHTKNGILRFTLKEKLLPDRIRPTTITINKDRVNIKNNYKLIEELIHLKE
jgi:hypothetical protein